ncbi:GTP cyclohydrolase 1 type 2/Nif3 [Lineolata rhizophorae]|uniref:ATP phosphoribosyltransferase n=1 Tax=Lineolata rhizophorae TaxID=578093 RepID=A0A6A6P614_9PEZI|nr:GTP cyclohydrolase 1 type 2/Nif3 [Lineolata rhizophorae]
MSLSAVPARYKLVFFVPPTALPQCKSAIFAAGAGKYPGKGNYTECCFTTPGFGQFRPGPGTNPNVGEPGKLEEVGEVRCETLCVGEDVVSEAVAALKKAHPYEEPAYEVYRIEDF